MEPLLHVLMLWLSLNSGLPTTPDQPLVRQLPSDQIAAMRYGPAASRTNDLLAVYDSSRETIVLRDDWDARTPADVSVLVHELIHHLQHRSEQTFECPGAREAQAYAAQDEWLRLFGLSLESAFAIDPMTLKLRTSCLPY